jgi:hypothetical protein
MPKEHPFVRGEVRAISGRGGRSPSQRGQDTVLGLPNASSWGVSVAPVGVA